MQTVEKEDNVFLNRASRSTRGKRMTKILNEEIEEDELFWNQEALKEEEVDDNYEEGPEVADVFDSDFDDDEPEPEEELEKEVDDSMKRKKKLVYPGKQPAKKKKKVLSELEQIPQDERSPHDSTAGEPQDVPEDVEVERTLRKSTRTSVVVRQAERDAIRASLQLTMKPIKKKKEGEEKKITQEEMLLEAAQTEIMNLRNLERVLAREEEVKKRAVVNKAVYSGPQIRYISTNGDVFLEFTGVSFHKEIATASPSIPEKAICVVTGLPAKYRDPKTGLPYATKEAFQIIRKRLSDETKPGEKTGIGGLSDCLSEQGFSRKQKRSAGKERSDTTHPHSFVRSYRFPPFEKNVDSD
ncbi:SWR1 complex subunit 2 [Impatiens glandulifera]|uniref:SWR1 complex subunit 2 n=1 Tax=Impatiens glandulifera TaxID=253017 RepID=UPI001FB05310|nr:SWR1 complex subunit 2 [Impatiens glandulifera]XP_047334757.1 SWR1 complex subunit 2 [Impatiens glandulifera]XP_047334758.1 SWR1 complex subunit 2 [Impatiens glandulifera]